MIISAFLYVSAARTVLQSWRISPAFSDLKNIYIAKIEAILFVICMSLVAFAVFMDNSTVKANNTFTY